MDRQEKLTQCKTIARANSDYRELEGRFLRWEKAFLEMTNGLTDAQQDIAWGFVCALNALDEKLLEIVWDLSS